MNAPCAETVRLPDPGAGFDWDERGASPVLRPGTGAAVAAFTTRGGGFCPPPWDTLNVSFRVGDGSVENWGEMVLANRGIAGRTIGGGERWSNVRQVHGGEIVRAVHGLHASPADALWTEDPKRTIAVLAADCLPVLLIGDGRIAAVHAGWRGLVAGVIQNAVAAAGASAAFVGPAIGPCCYAVGPEVAERLERAFGPGVLTERGHADLWRAAELAARAAGLAEIQIARLCTSCHPGLFFSHRRDAGRTGRQALVARLALG